MRKHETAEIGTWLRRHDADGDSVVVIVADHKALGKYQLGRVKTYTFHASAGCCPVFDREWWVKYATVRSSRYNVTPEPSPDTSAVCYFCGELLVSIGDAFLCLYSQEVGPPFISQTHERILNGGRVTRGALAYPGNGTFCVESGVWNAAKHIAVFSHAECGPEIGYNIALHQILGDGARHWIEHLRQKAHGFVPVDELRAAELIAARLLPETK